MNRAIDPSETQGPPIFIVGNGRTGTTLLRMMLSAHPRIYICHELWFYVWDSLCPKSYDGREFFDHWTRTFNFRWLQMDKGPILERLPHTLPRKQAGLAFRETMREKAAIVGKVRYGEKTPGHIANLKQIYRDFPDARVIVMVRDPRTTISSVGEMFWGSRKDLANCLLYEYSRRKAAQYKDQALFVRLEDLRIDPRATMERVLAFVGEEWEDAVLDHTKHRDDPNDMQPVYFLESAAQALVAGESRLGGLSPERTSVIEKVCARSMKEYGYEPASREGGLRTWLRVVSQAPEALRYIGAALSMVPTLRKPVNWGSLADATRGKIRNLNPRFWRDHPDFTLPKPPERV